MTLIDIEERKPNWVLDRQTREVGLKGIALARAVLAHQPSPAAAKFTPDTLLREKLRRPQ